MSCIRTRGKKSTRHPDAADPPRRRANKQKGKGSYANDRPPILSLISRTSHEVRYWVLEHADKPTTRTIIEGNVPPQSTILYTDEASNYPNVHPQHASVCHSIKEWARYSGPVCQDSKLSKLRASISFL
jgi:transposase